MAIYYTTVTSKGQITLPAHLRRHLKLSTGNKVAVKLGKDRRITIEGPPDLEAVRQKTAQYLRAKGYTPNKLRNMAAAYQSGEGFTAYVREKYGEAL